MPIIFKIIAQECPYDDDALRSDMTVYMRHKDAWKNPVRHVEVLTECGIDLDALGVSREIGTPDDHGDDEDDDDTWDRLSQ